MRLAATGTLLLATTLALLPTTTFGQGWQSDFEAARKLSERTGKPLLVHFWAEWCGPCRQMDSTVFNQPQVISSLASDVIAVKINVDQRKDLSARFGIESLPSDIILEPSGERMMESVGYRTVPEYVQLLSRAKSRQIELARTRKQRATPPATAQEPSPSVASGQGVIRPIAAQGGPMLDGYCPVMLSQSRKWVKGSSEHAAEFRGQVYHLSTAEALKTFQEDPRRYTPRFLGCDPVIVWESDRAVRGLSKFGAFYDDELYLFTSAENRDRFKQEPDRFIRTRIVLQPDLIETVVR